MPFKKAQKITKHFGFSCKKICNREFSQIAQSGHTVYDLSCENLKFEIFGEF